MVLSILMAALGIGASWHVYHRRRVDTAALQARWHGGYRVLQGQYDYNVAVASMTRVSGPDVTAKD